MGIQIEKTFTVAAPASAVWAFLTDPHRVAGCLPGAAISGQTDDRTYTGTIKVKVGPVATSYKGTVRFEELDEEAGTASLTASGQEARGKGGAKMTMTSRLVESGGTTEVSVVSDVSVTGILAQFGRGMIVDVSDQMFQLFTTCVSAQLQAETAGSAGASAGAGGASGASEAGAAGDRPGAGERAGEATGRGAAGPPAAAHTTSQPDAIDAIALGRTVSKRALVRAIRKPGFYLVIAVLAAVILMIVR